MKTKRLTLRNVEITDAKLLAQWKNDPDLQEMSTGQKSSPQKLNKQILLTIMTPTTFS